MSLINYLTRISSRLYSVLETSPARAFWLFVLAQLLLWTLIPAFVFQNLPLDVIELVSWGHEWQLGYSKHPPMPAWFLEAFAVLSGRADWTAFFISELSIVFAYWVIWRLGRETVGDMGALLAVLLTSLIYYYNLPAIEFNHNILAITFWALLGLYGWLALRDDRLRDWLLLGLFAGLSIYVKYSQAIMVLTLISFLIVYRDAWPRFKSVGLWLGVAVALLVALPHLYWMYSTEFQSLFYASGRTKPLVGIGAHIVGPLKFLLAQLAVHGGLLLVLVLGGAILPMDRRRGIEPIQYSCDNQLARRYILWIALVPVLFLTFLSFVLGMEFRSMWGAPMFSFSALALMVLLKPFLFKERFGFMVASWVLLHVGLLAALVIMGTAGAQLSQKISRTDYPGRDVGEYFSKLWREKTGTPLRFVDGDEWIGGNISYYARERPSQVSKNDQQAKPWINWQKVICKGTLVVWPMSGDKPVPMPAGYGAVFSHRDLTGYKVFATKLASAPVRVGWAIIPPTAECK